MPAPTVTRDLSLYGLIRRTGVIYFEPRDILNPGSKYRCEILTPPHNILNPGFIILWLQYDEPRFKILWLRNIEPPTSYIFKGVDSEYYGCETLTPFWFSL
jgi:hypothetical protein